MKGNIAERINFFSIWKTAFREAAFRIVLQAILKLRYQYQHSVRLQNVRVIVLLEFYNGSFSIQNGVPIIRIEHMK